MIAVFISSIAGFIISSYSTGGMSGTLGFGIGAVFWFASNILAFVKIKKGKVREHEKWMMRNYMGTFAAVTLRIQLPIILACGADIVQALAIVAWISWIPNLIGIEVYIQRKYGGMLKAKVPLLYDA